MIDRFEHFSYAINEINKCWHKIAVLVPRNLVVCTIKPCENVNSARFLLL